ncbi:hypothetical protein GRI62_06460 [Erythrobacter arachoides]|uniref:Polysaccharide pyruvyl transferase domain-containing protein n=1 Tax=Aurantiacibacter arachoides TaxID=1850444 RepID=A0A844ZZV3_9SPHN|nr:polysaccharide pyruvyl transferase family protein [Aurantiacibacter arachoides]MXO93248.1 hypothetical protein [Aurantiacibacter arachoides]GGD50787.1 hypothetical protein GCM10011411_08350 [Aurantiacibacter arachoides]
MSAMIFFLVRTQYENTGDLAINRECIKLLRQRGVLHVNVSGVPDAFVNGLQLYPQEIVSPKTFWANLIFQSLRGLSVYLFLVPGGLGGYDYPYRPLKELLFRFVYASLRKIGVRIIRLGCSFSPVLPSIEIPFRKRHESIDFIGLRDSTSLAYARALGLENVGFFPDFAFMLEPVAGEEAEGSYAVLSFRSRDATEAAIITATVQKFLQMVDRGRKLSVVIAVQVEFDRSFAKDLASVLSSDRQVSLTAPETEIDKFIAIYQGADWLLSNRLHVLIFGLIGNANTVALTNYDRDQKIIGMFEDLEIAERLIAQDGSNLSNVTELSVAPNPRAIIRMKDGAGQLLDRILISDWERPWEHSH